MTELSLVFTPEICQQTSDFIALLLAYDDEPQLCIQHLSDAGDSRVKPIKFLGFDEIKAQPFTRWRSLNQQGYYTNACLNVFAVGENGPKKSARTVSRVRGQVVDIDSYLPFACLEALLDEFKPTFVVLSSFKAAEGVAKAHFYWMYDLCGQDSTLPADVVELSNTFLIKNFKDLQTVLALKVEAFASSWCLANGLPDLVVKTDKQLTPLSIALRIPGLYHTKRVATEGLGAASLTTLWYRDGLALTTPMTLSDEDLESLKAYKSSVALTVGGGRKLPTTGSGSGVSFAGGATIYGVHQAAPEGGDLSMYAAAAEGERNKALYEFVLRRLLKDKGLTQNEAMGAAWFENQAQNKPPLSDAEVSTIVMSAWRGYQEWLKEHATKLPVNSVLAKTIHMMDIEDGVAEADALARDGIEVDVIVHADGSESLDLDPDGLGVFDEEGAVKVKKKSRSTLGSTDTSLISSKRGRGRPRKSTSLINTA